MQANRVTASDTDGDEDSDEDEDKAKKEEERQRPFAFPVKPAVSLMPSILCWDQWLPILLAKISWHF